MEEKDRELHAIKLENEAVCQIFFFSSLLFGDIDMYITLYFYSVRHGLNRTFFANKTKSLQLSGFFLKLLLLLLLLFT